MPEHRLEDRSMTQPVSTAKPQITFDIRQCPLSPLESQVMQRQIESLTPQVANFPVADLHVLIEGNPRRSLVNVKLKLILPGNTLVASDHDVVPQPALERCLYILTDKLREYKDRLGQV